MDEEDDGNVIDDEDDVDTAQDEDGDEDTGEGEGTMGAASIGPSRRCSRMNFQSSKLVPEFCYLCHTLFT